MFVVWAEFDIRTGRAVHGGITDFSGKFCTADWQEYAASRGFVNHVNLVGFDMFANPDSGTTLAFLYGYSDRASAVAANGLNERMLAAGRAVCMAGEELLCL